MKARYAMLKRDNLFEYDAPQAGDVGVIVDKFYIPNIDAPWYRVEFRGYDEGAYTCPESVLELFETRPW